MNPADLRQHNEFSWEIPARDGMHVPGVIYADQALIRAMDGKVAEQVANVARLPGIVAASYAMPDAHWGYGFPIGGVAAFDPEAGGVVSAGGVGFDISCGVRCLHTGVPAQQLEAVAEALAEALFNAVPCGAGRPRHPRAQPVPARRGRGGPRRLQGRHRRGGRRPTRRPGAHRGPARAHGLHQGIDRQVTATAAGEPRGRRA